MNIEISIIIPHLQGAKNLCECIESIQTDINHEIIVIDNHSKDNSIEEAKKKFDYIKIIHSKIAVFFTSSFFNIEPYLIMQAHLIGWCTGTLCSMASLSVITCSNLFKVPSHKVAFGVNVYVVLGFSLLGGAFLSIINQLIKYF